MRCAKCGSANPVGKKFCGDCGAPLANRCAQCGADNPPGKSFCGDCGAALLAARSPVLSWQVREIAPTTEQERAPTTVDGERKMISALFADIKGSTELIRDLDPEEARAVIDPVLQLMMDAVHRYDGYVVQSAGDGIFALFGAPVAHEDHAQRAVHAAIAMRDTIRRHAGDLTGRPAPEVRIGINTGEAVLRLIHTGGHTEYTPVGHAANLAARMQSAAPAGEIVISADTRHLVEGYFQLRELGPTEVKGVAQPINIYEVTGAGSLHGHFDLAVRHGLTRFVGRESELKQIAHALELARGGRGQIVAVVAEAGGGKSRLFYEFKATLPADCKVVEAYSVSHGKASAWLPVLALLHDYFGILEVDDRATRREKLRAALATLDPALSDTQSYLFTLLAIPENPDPIAHIDAQVKRRRTLEVLKRIVLRESLKQPIVVIFEDLHWIDDQTQALLDLLANGIGNARSLMLVNYRPEYRHEWGNKSYYSQLRLDALGRESAAEMLSTLLGVGVELNPLKRLIIERTEGNPFFIEEMVQALFDEGAIVRNGAVKLTRPLTKLRLPPTIQGILASRIDRLPAAEKDLLQTLAVIGRESPMRLLRRVARIAEAQLVDALAILGTGEFVYEQPATTDVDYVFKHALTQEVAYNSLLIERRKQLHEGIGQTIEALYGDRLDDHVGALAHHYSHSDNGPKAVEYLRLAGQQAAQRSAHAGAISHLTSALEVLKTLPDTLQRAQQELVLQTTLGPALIVTKGNGAAEVGAVYARAVELGRQVRDEAQLFPVLFGLRSFHLTRGELVLASAEAEQLVSLAERLQDSGLMVEAHLAQGNSLFSSEELIPALEHLERAAALYDPEKHRSHAYVYGLEPGVFCLGRIAWCLVLLGYPDRALQKVEESMALAQKQQHPYSLAIARGQASLVYDLRGDRPALQQENAEAGIALCAEQGFANALGHSTHQLGAALAMQGRVEEGIELMRKGVAAARATGQGMFQPNLLLRWAEALLLAGRFKEGLAVVAEAKEMMGVTGDRFGEAKLLCVRGELLLAMDSSNATEAEQAFRDAVEVTRLQSAKLQELRATTSLARLLRDTNRRDEACAMLAEIYNWFTEGFDTADLKNAKALLKELAT
jgi:predicted ATPase/class 3 adenylate cyclase